MAKVIDDKLGRHLLEVELQTTRQYRHWDFLRIGRRQDELDMRRRFLQRLQHGVEGRIRQHVYFVDDIDLKATARRRIHGVFQQLPHFIDLGVSRRIHFEQIDETAAVDFRAGGTSTTGRRRHAGFTIERFGENARQRCLADAARAGKEIGVVQPLLIQRVRQRPHDVLLADQAGKCFRPPFARQNLITHAPILPRITLRPKIANTP